MQRLVATEKFHRYSSDRPLERLADDALEREGFVERLSSDILGWHGRDSLVISINGEWGSGKTTMQNFLKETLLKQANPVIIEFNPWQWSAQDRLFEAFFYAVGAAFRITDAKEETIKLTEKWEAFAAWTRIGAAISTKLEQAITPLVGTSITAALLANTSGSPAIRIIGILLGLTGMCEAREISGPGNRGISDNESSDQKTIYSRVQSPGRRPCEPGEAGDGSGSRA